MKFALRCLLLSMFTSPLIGPYLEHVIRNLRSFLRIFFGLYMHRRMGYIKQIRNFIINLSSQEVWFCFTIIDKFLFYVLNGFSQNWKEMRLGNFQCAMVFTCRNSSRETSLERDFNTYHSYQFYSFQSSRIIYFLEYMESLRVT